MENLFGKNEDFEYLDFGNIRKGRMAKDKSMICYCPTNADGIKRSCVYSVVFSSEIANEVKAKGFSCLRISVNRLTNETYFVFSKEKSNDSLRVIDYGGKDHKKCVYNKGLVEFIMQTIGIEKDGRVIREIEIGPNISRIDDALVYKLLGVGW